MKLTLILSIDLGDIEADEHHARAWARCLIARHLTTLTPHEWIADARREGNLPDLARGLWYEAMARAIADAADHDLNAYVYDDDPSEVDAAFLARAEAWLRDNPWTDADEQRLRLNEADARAEKLLAWARMAGDRGLEEAAAAACAEADLLDGVIHVSVACDLIAERRAK